MSDAPPARGIVLAHGTLAEGLVEAVRQIAGVEGDALVAMTNRGESPESLARQVEARLGDGPVVVFTDLPSGSCGFAARRLCRERPDLLVICGVNLPMILDFVTHRDLSLADMAARFVEKGRAGIVCVPMGSGDHARTTLSGG